MLTILEGPDGGGKSTFARYLTARGRDYTRDHGPYKGEVEIAHHYWKSITDARGWPVVMDRSWIAEPIYGAAFRDGADRIGVARRRMLERAAYAVRGVVALFLPPYEECRRAFISRLQEEYLDTPHQLADVYDGYLGLIRGVAEVDVDRYLFGQSLPYVVADWTRHSPAAIAGMIEAVRPPANGGPGTGYWAPDDVVVLVGDRPGTTPGPEIEPEWSPFTTWSGGGCSAWLAETLEEAGISERALYWVNAHDGNGKPTDYTWLTQLRPRAVVCLGNNAAKWLDAWDGVKDLANVSLVEHPQFWKRFHHNDRYALVDAILESLAS